jgi:excisionase family DNA binding protein
MQITTAATLGVVKPVVISIVLSCIVSMPLQPPSLTPLFITRPEAARMLAVNLRTVDAWIANGTLPVIRKGRRCVRIRYADLQEFASK